MIAVTGYSTTICEKLRELTAEPMVRVPVDLGLLTAPLEIPDAERYVFAAGVIHPKPLAMQEPQEIIASLSVNYTSVVKLCELALRRPSVRIAVIGSQSAVNGSYDEMYAGMKAALHNYVRNRHLAAGQRLVCVAPSIIADSGMTRRRSDYPAVLTLRSTCSAMDVAREVYDVLYKDTISPVRIWPV